MCLDKSIVRAQAKISVDVTLGIFWNLCLRWVSHWLHIHGLRRPIIPFLPVVCSPKESLHRLRVQVFPSLSSTLRMQQPLPLIIFLDPAQSRHALQRLIQKSFRDKLVRSLGISQLLQRIVCPQITLWFIHRPIQVKIPRVIRKASHIVLLSIVSCFILASYLRSLLLHLLDQNIHVYDFLSAEAFDHMGWWNMLVGGFDGLGFHKFWNTLAQGGEVTEHWRLIETPASIKTGCIGAECRKVGWKLTLFLGQ